MSPQSIDHHLLAAELGAAVAEFNRLANLASAEGLLVQAEIIQQQMVDQSRAPREHFGQAISSF